MTAFQTRITRMALLAVCSAALTAPLAVLAQDTPPLPPAQNGGGPGGGRGGNMQEREARQLDMMTTQLNLTTDQVTAIKQIDADTGAKMQALFSDQSGGGDRRTQMMALRTDRETKIRAVLTPAQQPKYDEMVQRQHERMERGGGPGGNGGSAPASTPQ
jgi:Spy/CpxP family protein refolding chaperone